MKIEVEEEVIVKQIKTKYICDNCKKESVHISTFMLGFNLYNCTDNRYNWIHLCKTCRLILDNEDNWNRTNDILVTAVTNDEQLLAQAGKIYEIVVRIVQDTINNHLAIKP